MNQYSKTIYGVQDKHPDPFSFSGPVGLISGRDGRLLVRGTGADLAGRLAGVGGLIGGALPFDQQGQDYLWRAGRTGAPPASAMPGLGIRQVRAEPAPQVYAASVAQALGELGTDLRTDLRKVVLARTLAVTADDVLPQEAIFARLAQDATVTAFRVVLPGVSRALIGATPELLVSKAGRQITSHPLAGSARRQVDTGGDRAARDGLAGSDKDRREHAIVVEYILDMLTPLCRDLGSGFITNR